MIEIPFDPNQQWGIKRRHDVTGTINNISIRGPLEKDDDCYFLLLGPAWRRDSGLDANAQVTVVLMPEGPQIATMAEDLQLAFAKSSEATAFFNSLPTFYRKNYMRWIDSAKRPETRTTRIAEMISLLNAEKRER